MLPGGGPWKVVARKDALVVDPADLAKAKEAAAALPASLRTGAGDMKKLSPTSSSEALSRPDLNLEVLFKSDEPGTTLASKRDTSLEVVPGLYADDVDAATREKVNAYVAAMTTILEKAKAAPTPPEPPQSFEMKRTLNGEKTDLLVGARGEYTLTKGEGEKAVTVRGTLSAQELADFAKEAAAFTKEAKPGDESGRAPTDADTYTLSVETSRSANPFSAGNQFSAGNPFAAGSPIAKGSDEATAKPASALLALLDGFVTKYGEPPVPPAAEPAASRGIANAFGGK
jgi:hypothetical protein